MTNHTPGPWYVYSFDTNVGKSVQVKNDAGREMHGVVCIMKKSRGNKEANATLISLAPEMKAFIESLTDAAGPYPFLDQTQVVSDARALLAKLLVKE